MSHQTESLPPLSAAEVASGEGSASFVVPHPQPLPHSSRLENTGKSICRDTQPPPAGGTRLRMCSLCRCLRRHPWAGRAGPGLRMRVGEECCPQNFKGQGKAGARGNDTKMPSPTPWILLKKARNSDANLSPVAKSGP